VQTEERRIRWRCNKSRNAQSKQSRSRGKLERDGWIADKIRRSRVRKKRSQLSTVRRTRTKDGRASRAQASK
jgi:hypothetical protein